MKLSTRPLKAKNAGSAPNVENADCAPTHDKLLLSSSNLRSYIPLIARTTKKVILEQIRAGVTSVAAIAVNVGISKGMAYNHLRELKAMGYITGEDGYSITDAGKIAVI